MPGVGGFALLTSEEEKPCNDESKKFMQRYFKGLIWALATWITSQTIMRQKGLVFDSRLWFGGGGGEEQDSV